MGEMIHLVMRQRREMLPLCGVWNSGSTIAQAEPPSSAPGRNRTYDLLIRSQLLYPLSYRGPVID